jgi:hypothetical protein
MNTILTYTAIALVLCAVAGALTRRLAMRHLYAFLTGAAIVWGVRGAREGDTAATVIDAALAAFYAWRWWKNGGGDDTKRRLRSLGRRFSPVRRTAPSAA